jgi:U4/U6.U5 tri-snRNP-associated protein 2
MSADDDLADVPQLKRRRRVVSADECPYLDTVNRAVLDFDFEKVCSVSLLSTNIYGCLVCGKYFQVRQVIKKKNESIIDMFF